MAAEAKTAGPALPAVTEQPAVLRIHGPGGYHSERALEAGAAIEFSGLDEQGGLLADGTYEWELRTFKPSGEEEKVTTGVIVLAEGLPMTDPVPTLEPGVEPGGSKEPLLVQPSLVEPHDHPHDHPHLAGDRTITGDLCVGSHCTSGFSPDAFDISIAQTVTAGESLSLNLRDVQSEPCASAGRCWSLNVLPARFELNNELETGTELVVATDGDVGIGTAAPAADLHIDPADSAWATVRLSGQAGLPVAVDWEMRLSGITGGLEFRKAAGSGAFSTVMTLEGFNDRVTVHGDFTAGSSRSIKRDFAPVSGAEVLAKLAELPVQSWSYKRDEQGARHLGVVAEDFHEAFGLGADAEHIAPLDTAGVAFAAIQELHGRLQRRERDIELLIAANEELRGELAALRRTLEKTE